MRGYTTRNMTYYLLKFLVQGDKLKIETRMSSNYFYLHRLYCLLHCDNIQGTMSFRKSLESLQKYRKEDGGTGGIRDFDTTK